MSIYSETETLSPQAEQPMEEVSSAVEAGRKRAPWMRMNWEDLLFMHWPVAPALLRKLLPEKVELETFDGKAWLGIVPFRMSGVGFRGLPNLPFASSFPELNVRTYVNDGQRSGVWFFSLDATSRLAVWGGRVLYRLPYKKASIDIDQDGHWIRYQSRRDTLGGKRIGLKVEYRPLGKTYSTAPGTLEHFLTARDCLFTQGACGRIFRGDVRHPSWQLQTAQAIIHDNTMTAPLGIELPSECPVLHFSRRTRVVAWSLRERSRA
jgi:uncharacterized protein YqjF (DUF2071 family)